MRRRLAEGVEPRMNDGMSVADGYRSISLKRPMAAASVQKRMKSSIGVLSKAGGNTSGFFVGWLQVPSYGGFCGCLASPLAATFRISDETEAKLRQALEDANYEYVDIPFDLGQVSYCYGRC